MANSAYTDAQLLDGARKLRSFTSWQTDNPRAWRFGVSYALDTVRAGQHIAGRAIVEQVRRHDFTDEHGSPTRISNNYAAIIARVLLRDYPEFTGHIELRPCVFDVLLPAGGGASE